jgi:hypothetical protein
MEIQRGLSGSERQCNFYLRTGRCRKAVNSNSCPAGIQKSELETVVCGKKKSQCPGRELKT